MGGGGGGVVGEAVRGEGGVHGQSGLRAVVADVEQLQVGDRR
jgi:hypothetical protein